MVDHLSACPHYNIMTDEAYANLKSSLFYLALNMVVCLFVFYVKFLKDRGNFLTYENFFFLFYLIFFIVACTKAFNYRSILNEREYLRNLEFREVLYEEELKMNRKFQNLSDDSDDYAKRDEDDTTPADNKILPKNAHISFDYLEKSLFKEIIIKI